MSALQDDTRFSSEIALLQPCAPSAKVLEALIRQFGGGAYMVSKSARTRGGDQVAVGDVVLYGDGANTCAGKIGMLASADVNGELILVALVEGFTRVTTTYGNDVWKPTGLMRVCLLASIDAHCAWCPHGDNDMLTLRPIWMR